MFSTSLGKLVIFSGLSVSFGATMLSGVLRGVGAGRKWSIKYAIEAFGGNLHIWELVILCRLCLMTRYKKDGSGEKEQKMMIAFFRNFDF